MTPEQVKAARELLGWTRVQLGSRSGVGDHVVAAFEKTGYIPNASRWAETTDRLAAIRAALEAAGIEFIKKDGNGSGVRLRQSSSGSQVLPERRSIGPEDETRGGPEAPEPPEVQTDD